MIKMNNCSVINCGSVFGLNGDLNIRINGLYVDRCGTVFNIKDSSSNINAYTNNITVKNTDTYIKVGEDKQSITPNSSQVNPPKYTLPSIHKTDDSSAIMRIAFQYLNSMNK
jgi:hypothetical protein